MEIVKKLKLKKDWAPFPKGTIFSVKRGCAEDMLHSPSTGNILPNGIKVTGSLDKNWVEYTRMFDYVGGINEWFEVVNERTDHLEWIYGRLIHHGELENVDYMLKFKEIIMELKKV